MEVFILEGSAFTDKKTSHRYLKERLGLPHYYGNNLDALWDCLSTAYSERMIVFRNPQLLQKNLGRYGCSLLQVFQDVKQENPHTRLVYSYSFP